MILRLTFLFSILQSIAAAQAVRLRSGEAVQADIRSLDGKTLTLSDGRSFPRESVQEIELAVKASEPPPAAVDPTAAARSRELFRQAEEFGKKRQGADGLVLLDQGNYRVKEDGTWVERDRFAGQILKDSLKQAWGELSMDFEEGRDRARIIKATVYHPDGKSYPLDPSRIKILKPQGDALFFEENRTLVYPLPQVEVGSIVEWEIEKETYNPFRKDFFFPRWGFQNSQPTLVSKFEIALPSAKRLFYAARNFDGALSRYAAPRVETKDGVSTYTWELKDRPEIVSEPDMAPFYDYAPSVKAALFEDWSRIYDWLLPMYKERTQPGPELAQFSRQLVLSCRTDDERIAAIYHYVEREIRYIAVKMGVASGWGGYDANLTWKRRYGCCIDKALLLTAMLNAIGVKSVPVLLDTNRAAKHDFRVPDIWFEHAITHVTPPGREFFLDSTGYHWSYPAIPEMDHGVQVLDVFSRGTDEIPLPKPEENARVYEYSISLSSSGDAEVTLGGRYTGAEEGNVRGYFKSQKESDQRRMFQDWVSGVSPSGELLDFNVENAEDLDKPLSFSIKYRLPEYPIKAADLLILKLPDFESDFGEVSLGKRLYDLEYPSASETHRKYRISLPEGYKAVSLIKTAAIWGPKESYIQGCKSRGGELVCDAVLKRRARTYEPRAYRDHKAFLERVSRLTKDRIFLEAPKLP